MSTDSPDLYIEWKTSGIHGTGAFARRVIRSGVKLIRYVGEVIDKQESTRRCEAENPFIFELDETHDIDGGVDWNPARFINHSCAPNCEALNLEGEIWISTTRRIAKGEELTFNYGYDLEDFLNYPCRCGARECSGFMVGPEYAEEARKRSNPSIACSPTE